MAKRARQLEGTPTPRPPGSGWGQPPWELDFRPRSRTLPAEVDVAIIGGGFTGLAAAAWVVRMSPGTSVAVLEAGELGAGASGRTGGVALDETAAGALPGLGPVLDAFIEALAELQINCDLERTGAWEISRQQGRAGSPLAWRDSGLLRVAHKVSGATLDPARLLAGLARAAEVGGAALYTHTRVRSIHFEHPLRLELPAGTVQARRVLLAVNATGFNLSPWRDAARAFFTLAVATGPLSNRQMRHLCAQPLRPFYTIDLPYLWGRPLPGNRVLFGGGLVPVESEADLAAVDVEQGQAKQGLASLQARVRGLVPALRSVEFTHRWGGPILFSVSRRPFLCHHPQSSQVVLLGGYTGHGIAQSVHLAQWAVEALLGRRPLPEWGRPDIA